MTIRAVGVTSYGGPEALHEVDLPDPTTGPGQVRGIAVRQLNVRTRATDHAAIQDLRDRAENGALAMRVVDVLPATHAAEAHRLLDRGGLRGRLVLDFTA
jgi:NADPH:quinone reductase-like Zn-dependent oxidoreductase